jgi:hypothetical protein
LELDITTFRIAYLRTGGSRIGMSEETNQQTDEDWPICHHVSACTSYPNLVILGTRTARSHVPRKSLTELCNLPGDDVIPAKWSAIAPPIGLKATPNDALSVGLLRNPWSSGAACPKTHPLGSQCGTSLYGGQGSAPLAHNQKHALSWRLRVLASNGCLSGFSSIFARLAEEEGAAKHAFSATGVLSWGSR